MATTQIGSNHQQRNCNIRLVWLIYSFTLVIDLPYGDCIVCSQCDSVSYPQCDSFPPIPSPCSFCEQSDNITGACLRSTHFDFCITMRKYVNDSLVSTTRACNPISIGADCKILTDKKNREIEICFDSCREDGCNGLPKQLSNITLITGLFIFSYISLITL